MCIQETLPYGYEPCLQVGSYHEENLIFHHISLKMKQKVVCIQGFKIVTFKIARNIDIIYVLYKTD